MVRVISVDRGDIGIRVDRVLLRHLRDVPGISRNKIQRLIQTGAVLLNDKAAPRISWRVAVGDRLTIELPDTARRQRPSAESLPLDVLYEDDHLLVVNKPPGQVAHPAFRNTTGTLLNALARRTRGTAGQPALVSRLDKDTSGLVLVAKRREVHAALQRLMQRNAIEKDYLAIVRRPAVTGERHDRSRARPRSVGSPACDGARSWRATQRDTLRTVGGRRATRACRSCAAG